MPEKLYYLLLSTPRVLPYFFEGMAGDGEYLQSSWEKTVIAKMSDLFWNEGVEFNLLILNGES